MEKQLVVINPATLLQDAVQTGQSVDNLISLMGLYSEWKKESARMAFYSALTLFQETVAPIKRTSAVDYPARAGFVKFKFAALSEIITTIRPALAAARLSVRWTNDDAGGKLKVTCFVTHVDGHCEFTCMEAEPDLSGSKNAIQAKGSTLTYLQRYTVSMALGIVTEDDLDGNAPEVKQENGKKKIPTEKQVAEMKVRMRSGAVTIEKIKEHFEITTELEDELNFSE